MVIYEFVPDIYHLWKYKGVKKDSYDGKIFIYDKYYHLINGYLYRSGIAIGQIAPNSINQSQQTAIRKTDAIITDCSSSIEAYINSAGYYEGYILLTCNSTYIPDSYFNNTAKMDEVIDGGGVSGGGGGTS